MQYLGVPVAGPIEWYSHRFADRLVGNDDSAVGSAPSAGVGSMARRWRPARSAPPKIATVNNPDLPLAGQLARGDWIEFLPVSRATGCDALRQRLAALSGLS